MSPVIQSERKARRAQRGGRSVRVTAERDQRSAHVTAERDSRWERVLARDRSADGEFFYSVATTGVYCRPSCAARPANPRNVDFHVTQAAAEAAGFRPCKRCKPDRIGEISFGVGKCSLGSILVAQSEQGVCAILLGDEAGPLVRDLEARFPRSRLARADAALASTLAKVVRFVETPHSALNLPLDARGTAFQQQVWQALRAIPAGSTASYTAVAESVGRPEAVRAVAQACAANALAIAIPCHRVLRSDGSLSGYRWGVERKRVLLEREQNACR